MKFKRRDRIVRGSGKSVYDKGTITYRRGGMVPHYYILWGDYGISTRTPASSIDKSCRLDTKYYRDKTLTHLLE